MKKIAVYFVLTIILVLMFAVSVFAAEGENRPILYTIYRQEGWGYRTQIGVLYEDGSLGYLDCDDGLEDMGYTKAEELAYIRTHSIPLTGSVIGKDDLTDVRSMIAGVANQEVHAQSVACDAGSQSSYAVRYEGDTPEIICLGCAGDDVFENTDPAAQALYRKLRILFPDVIDFSDDKNVSPKGFEAMTAAEFLGYIDLNVENATLKAYHISCEEGPIEMEPKLTAEQILNCKVTGMRNMMYTTGETELYCFVDANGETIASFEFMGDLLVTQHGMFNIKW